MHGFGAIHPAARGGQVEGAGYAHQTGEKKGGARIGHQADAHEKLGEVGFLWHDDHVTGQRQRTACPRHQAVEAAYDGLGNVAQSPNHGIVAAAQGVAHAGVFAQAGFQVGPRAEGLVARPGQ